MRSKSGHRTLSPEPPRTRPVPEAPASEAGDKHGTAVDGVLAEVAQERVRQNEKWGEQNHPDGTGPTMTSLNRREQAQYDCEYTAERGTITYRHILTEEYYEALAESDPAKLRAELVQIAAVAVQWVEAIDRRIEREGAES